MARPSVAKVKKLRRPRHRVDDFRRPVAVCWHWATRRGKMLPVITDMQRSRHCTQVRRLALKVWRVAECFYALPRSFGSAPAGILCEELASTSSWPGLVSYVLHRTPHSCRAFIMSRAILAPGEFLLRASKTLRHVSASSDNPTVSSSGDSSSDSSANMLDTSRMELAQTRHEIICHHGKS